MAISVTTAKIHSLNLDRIMALASPSSSQMPSSFLQFPHQLRRFRVGDRGFSCRSQPRIHPLVEAKKQTFSTFDELLASSEKPVLVDFYATWCGPCQLMDQILIDVSVALEDKVQVVKIDTEKYPSIATKYRIEALLLSSYLRMGNPVIALRVLCLPTSSSDGLRPH